jgi:hypothetical protein
VNRLAPLVYSSEGEKIREQLWKETKAEFTFIDMDKIVEELKA